VRQCVIVYRSVAERNVSVLYHPFYFSIMIVGYKMMYNNYCYLLRLSFLKKMHPAIQ